MWNRSRELAKINRDLADIRRRFDGVGINLRVVQSILETAFIALAIFTRFSAK